MKKNFKSLLTIALVVGLGYAANAQQTTNASSSASILTSLEIKLETGTSIDFGNISANTPAAVKLDPNGLTNENTGTSTNVARFNITGADGAEMSVDYDATVQLILESVTVPAEATESEKLVMTSAVVGSADPENQAGAIGILKEGVVVIGDVDNVGQFYIWVGGTIPQLTGLNNTGIYKGTFNINVEYN
jgi:hypothetical protein